MENPLIANIIILLVAIGLLIIVYAFAQQWNEAKKDNDRMIRISRNQQELINRRHKK